MRRQSGKTSLGKGISPWAGEAIRLAILEGPQLGRDLNGVANRLDRIRALGNGQVPIVAARAWRELSDL